VYIDYYKLCKEFGANMKDFRVLYILLLDFCFC